MTFSLSKVQGRRSDLQMDNAGVTTCDNHHGACWQEYLKAQSQLYRERSTKNSVGKQVSFMGRHTKTTEI